MRYGWEDFNEALVRRIVGREARAVDTAPGGFIVCPLIAHAGERLMWLDGVARKGTDWHSDPELRFHASPTYVVRDVLDNCIVGRDSIREIVRGECGKAETGRLGH